MTEPDSRRAYFRAGREQLPRVVLNAALAQANLEGWDKLTRRPIARRAGVSAGSVSNAFGSMGALKDAVMALAIEQGLLRILAQGLAAGNDIARNAPPDLKAKALASLT